MLYAFKNKSRHAGCHTRSRAALANVTNAAAVPAILTASKPRVKRQLKVDDAPNNGNNRPSKRRSSGGQQPMELEPLSAALPQVPAGLAAQIDAKLASLAPLVEDYAPTVDAYLRQLEVRRTVLADFLERGQPSITENDRLKLVDWLISVHESYGLCPDTLYLTVNLLDRFLAAQPLSRSRFQLAGITAMQLASKYEDVEPHYIDDYLYISGDIYTRQDMVTMEKLILRVLDYSLGAPLPIHFFRRLNKAAESDDRTSALGEYLMELSACSARMCRFLPSEVAAAAVFLARLILQPSRTPWTPVLAQYSGHTRDELDECLHGMATVAAAAAANTAAVGAVRHKYATAAKHRVSRLHFYEVSAFVDTEGS